MSGRDDLPKVSEILQMERKDLQSLSRANGLPSNLKKDELKDQLVELVKSKRKKKEKNEESEDKEKRKKKRKNTETTSEEDVSKQKRKKAKQEDKPKKTKNKKVEDMEIDLEAEPLEESDEDFAPSERGGKRTGKGDGRASEKVPDKKKNEEKKERANGRRRQEKEEESSEPSEKKRSKGRKSKREKEGTKGKSELIEKGEKARKSKMDLEGENEEKGKTKMDKSGKGDKEGQERVKEDNEKGRKSKNDRLTKSEKEEVQERAKEDPKEKSKIDKEGAENVQGGKGKIDSEKKTEISRAKEKKPDEKKKDTPDFEDSIKKDSPLENLKRKDTPRETDKNKDATPQETVKRKDTSRNDKKKDTTPLETDKKKETEMNKKMTDKVKSNDFLNVLNNDKTDKPALQKSTPSEANKKTTEKPILEPSKGRTNTTIEAPPPKYPLYNTVMSYGKILAVLYEQFCISSRCIQFLNEVTGRFLCQLSKSISMINELSMDILRDTLKKSFIEGDLLEEIVVELQNSDKRYNDPKYFSFPLQNRAGLLLDLDQMHEFLVNFKVEVPRKVEICLGVIMECLITRIYISSLPPKPVKKGFLLTENQIRTSILADSVLSRVFKGFLEEVKSSNETLPVREYLVERKVKSEPSPAEDLTRLKAKLGYSIPTSLETFLKFTDGKLEFGVDPSHKIEANLESRPVLSDIFQMVGWLPIFTPSVDLITCLDIDSGYVLQLDIININTSFGKVISKNFLQYIQTMDKKAKPSQETPITSYDPTIMQLLAPFITKINV
eukprot:TRINITY_DN1031_c0_g1_i1.p1 TRINITY_DN1031_c0_g1~~TRINITY_DN1031_c0_g1_i1.p1  ORF type:complete len:780 (+),score=240.73 TRINITY_DN1031_c0_g1_i1:1397-3736(+)